MTGSLRIAGVLAALVSGGIVAACGDWPHGTSEKDRGHALFTGEVPLQGRLASHETDLPSEVLRCANCHSSASGEVARTVAPPLTRRALLELHPRDGGQPSRYDLTSFCTLLQRGESPDHLVVNVQMPRYKLDDRDCTALWRYLLGETHG